MRARCALAVFVLFGTMATVQASPREVGPQASAAAQPLRQFAQPTVASQAPLQHAVAIGMGTPIRPVAAVSGLSCVPFARMATGLAIMGDARLWWHHAAGRYLRGQAPERGAVLAFMASGGMRRGHVGVVSRVVDDRTLLMDHANWAGPGIRRGTVMRNVLVVDVSDHNDWTAVRVQVGHDRGALGRTYPTHGFIYNRPAGERIMTAAAPASTELAEAASPHAARHMLLAAEALAR
jgi:surface antigen